MAIAEIAYQEFFGIPLIILGGIITLCLLLLTASIAFLNTHGKRWIPFKYHKLCAYVTIVLAIAHGLLVLGANLGW